MNLDGALSIATTGLGNIQSRLGTVSQNVANAGTPDYSAEISTQENLVAGSLGMGVRTGATTRAVDLAMQRATFQQDTQVAGLTTTTTSLKAIDLVQGAPGQGSDLASLLGQVADQFTVLRANPSSGAQQQAVVTAAGNLTGGINALSQAYTAQRQAAQTGIAGAVNQINTALARIGGLSAKIVSTKSAGQSIADLENQRDAAVHGLSTILGIKTLNQGNGDLIVTTASGSMLPTRGGMSLQTSDAVMAPGSAGPAITLGQVDITGQIEGGQLGANIALRDTTLPAFQAELDEFSQNLASRFDAQGLTLFSEPNGTVPSGGGTPVQSGYVGFAGTIGVNAAVRASPALVRDGTGAVAGSSTGASAFTPNPAGGPAGFTALIDRSATFALGAEAQSGVPWPAGNTTGLGPDGKIDAPYAAPATLGGHAAGLVAAQAAVSAGASAQLSNGQALQQTLRAKLSAASGVNMDTEMSHMIELQNAYSANARIIGTVQTLFTDLLQMIR